MAFATKDAEKFQREFPYRSGTLVSHGEACFLVDSSGLLHALDSRLDQLAPPVPCTDLLTDIAPVAAESYLYIAGSHSVYTVDLLLWLQGYEFKPTPLCPSVAASCFSVSQLGVSVVAQSERSSELISWDLGHGQPSAPKKNDLSNLRRGLYTFAPVSCPGFAFLAQRSADAVLVCDLHRGTTTARALGGACLYSTPRAGGIACLIRAGENNRIIEVTREHTTVLVPTVPADTTWLVCGEVPGFYLWGNGSSVTLQTNRGKRQLHESGNIGVPAVAGGRALAISHDAVSSEVLSIDLSTGEVRSSGRIGEFGFSDIACAGSRLIVGNGRQLKSFAMEGE